MDRGLEMDDHHAYRHFMGKSEFEKSINSLLGLIEGVTIDSKINHDEIDFLETWLNDHRINASRHPFNELLPVVELAISDGILTKEERDDITWLCNRLTSSDYFNIATADMQKLHAIMAGIGADGEVNVEELEGLFSWLQEHEHLKTCWPYDEVESLILGVLADKKIDPIEHKLLMNFFGEFVSVLDNKTIVSPVIIEGSNVFGLCSVCPDITFADAVFCFTGSSYKYTRNQFEELIEKYGGKISKGITRKVNYLVVGADGNPCWAYACYGRKVEKAAELRRQGHSIVIVHENDFHDAVMDQ
ncbi:MAG: NAD-dependent DNA ligase [Gammaproteobacteria bacterium]|nr:NAD-dependent DNA ligase [Gammaproteobacteria bacterium]